MQDGENFSWFTGSTVHIHVFVGNSVHKCPVSEKYCSNRTLFMRKRAGLPYSAPPAASVCLSGSAHALSSHSPHTCTPLTEPPASVGGKERYGGYSRQSREGIVDAAEDEARLSGYSERWSKAKWIKQTVKQGIENTAEVEAWHSRRKRRSCKV